MMDGRSMGRQAEQRIVPRSVVLASADVALRRRLSDGLTGMRWTVREAAGGAEAMGHVEALRPEALLLDGWLPDLEVGEIASQMAHLYPAMDVLRLDGIPGRDGMGQRSPRRNELLHALREAREGSGSGPLDGQDEVQAAPDRMERRPVPSGLVAMSDSPSGSELLPEMIGASAAVRELARMVRLVAPRSSTVLIEGETGTGKELVAKAVHTLSPRAAKSFTVLNCAAIPESLLEAELFGHTRGAFTGAVHSRTGRIEAAHGGTLFLDEIGEMPLGLQAKLLRFLESGELQRVGENEVVRVDVRVVAATHQHLEQRSAEGTFRLDLYHRLAVFPVEVPALRDRMDDLPLLAEHFLARMGREMPRKSLRVNAVRKLAGYSWPGNVRELKHVLERGAILAGDSPEITAEEIRWKVRAG